MARKITLGFGPYEEEKQPRVADQIKSGADVAKGLGGRAPLGSTQYENTRHNLISESYPKSGKKFGDCDEL